MKTLTLLIGHSGVGKSTLAIKIAFAQRTDGINTVICEADNFMIDESGDYKFDPKKLGYCHKLCQEQCEAGMKNEWSVIVSNTNLTRKEREIYYKLADKYGYDVQEIFIRSPFKSVHGVPDWKIEEMKRKLEF